MKRIYIKASLLAIFLCVALPILVSVSIEMAAEGGLLGFLAFFVGAFTLQLAPFTLPITWVFFVWLWSRKTVAQPTPTNTPDSRPTSY